MSRNSIIVTNKKENEKFVQNSMMVIEYVENLPKEWSMLLSPPS